MKKICTLCKSNNVKTFLVREKDSLIKCQNCGVNFVWPFPTQKQIKTFYTQDHFAKVDPQDKNQSGYGFYFKEEYIWQKIVDKQIKTIQQFKNKGSLLDIGCGIGTLLVKAKKTGFDVYGLDVVNFSVKTCHKRGLKKVKHGSVEKLNSLYPNKKFDVIVASHILEHVSDPLKFISEIKGYLKLKGILYIAVPDSQSPIARIMGKKWFGYYHYQHFFIFSKKCLIKLVESFSFKLLKYGREGVVWSQTENIIKRIRLYYSPSSLIYKIFQGVQNFLKFFIIKKLPLMAGNSWFVFSKK